MGVDLVTILYSLQLNKDRHSATNLETGVFMGNSNSYTQRLISQSLIHPEPLRDIYGVNLHRGRLCVLISSEFRDGPGASASSHCQLLVHEPCPVPGMMTGNADYRRGASPFCCLSTGGGQSGGDPLDSLPASSISSLETVVLTLSGMIQLVGKGAMTSPGFH